MLKKNLKSLVENNNLNSTGNFEVIYDANAMSIAGGGTCQKLNSCDEYTGDCPNLTTCGTYSSPAV
ncbi:hypothetical protein FPZ42_07155 [Mucilaginibacter achroorhodeus]|uniref:Uncharacterized protein n=1 Tax=Mucilaginibacter achroorhodeus TaxID=2599294 RepID=A0A563U670_9SPHI|nr:hypothetical protein [Mucilaginibacter achroorhodeus]TWR26809.1 hypothetical protein FPZ42_07155 [Mucilaginibacter achroorhodeus]